MSHLKAFDKINELKETYFDIWEKVCDIESPTDYKPGVDAVGRFFVELAKERGWKVEICNQEVSGDVVCITMNSDVDKKPLCLSGHIDTVHPVGIFGEKPVHRDHEKIYGPGVTDCKGGVVSGFLAMDALYQCGFDKRPIQMLLQTDEETSSRGSKKATINYICEKAIQGEVFINLESHTTGRVCTSRKGVLTYKFNIDGITGHTSRCVTEGASAIADAAHKIIELEKFKDDKGITCVCSIINGGTATNTIPGNCTFTANFRFATKEQYKQIEEFVKRLTQTVHIPGCKCTSEILGQRPAMEETERNIKLLEKVNNIFSQTGLIELTPNALRGGSDAANVAEFGATCLDNLGSRGGCSHTINEFAWLESMPEAARRIVAIAYYL